MSDVKRGERVHVERSLPLTQDRTKIKMVVRIWHTKRHIRAELGHVNNITKRNSDTETHYTVSVTVTFATIYRPPNYIL